MVIPALMITILAVLGGLLSFLIGLVGWIVLKLMKDELHLNITFDSEKKN
jgi:uncharacterized protein YneF (UPF0154 family)